MAVPVGSAAKSGHFWRFQMSCNVVSNMCQKMFGVTGTILSRGFQKMTCFCRGFLRGLRQAVSTWKLVGPWQCHFACRASHLEKICRVWNVILRGRRSIWDTFMPWLQFPLFAWARLRRVILPASFMPFCRADAVLGDVATCHSSSLDSKLPTLPSTLSTITLNIPHAIPHSTLHITVDSWHSTSAIHTLQSTLCTPHFNTPHFTPLYTLHFTPRTLDCTLHTLHFAL